MIRAIEEQRGNLRIIDESGYSRYIPVGPSDRLLGWDSTRFCIQHGNGQISVFSAGGEKRAMTYLNPAINEIRNWMGGWLYFRDNQLRINYRLDIEAGQRINTG